jgi:hypothetical protein
MIASYAIFLKSNFKNTDWRRTTSGLNHFSSNSNLFLLGVLLQIRQCTICRKMNQISQKWTTYHDEPKTGERKNECRREGKKEQDKGG